MPLNALLTPTTDPTPIFELYRGSYATELLVAGVAHFRVIDRLAERPMTFEELRRALGIEERAAVVLICALRAMGLIVNSGGEAGKLTPSAIAVEHIVHGQYFDVSDYFGLAADSPGVKAMIQKLSTSKTASAFVFREGVESHSMEQEASARALTLALCGRAKNVAPHLAASYPIDGASTLLDVGGGTGIYAIAYLQNHPKLRATVLDRPEVLKVAAEFAEAYGVRDRLTLLPGDMFTTPLPGADVVLLSNILHDWDTPECAQLVKRCAAALPSGGGRLLIHDVFLNDELDGPLPIALYSAALFSITEGRAYSGAEYTRWLIDAGLHPTAIVPTLIHCGVMAGIKK
jgi:predicted O-methyltransferase YrrM